MGHGSAMGEARRTHADAAAPRETAQQAVGGHEKFEKNLKRRRYR